jgi:hypothetical protein
VTSIDVLPDDVLLAIFRFYVVAISQRKRDIEAWQSLVHVCRRWRSLVFESPRHLNLRLVCTSGTPARKTLDVWPALPMIVGGRISSTSVNDIVYALGHNDRVCQINLKIADDLEWDKVLATMQVPFPALTHLELRCNVELEPVIPDTFLVGSAPRLRRLTLESIPFPGIPKLLLSLTHLVNLDLDNITDSGYISPEAMATCLSVLTNLHGLSLSLDLLDSKTPSPRRPPPVTRSILPNLTRLWLKGASDYLEDLVARIDAPRLNVLCITFLDEMYFDTPHLVQFIGGIPRFEEPNGADIILYLVDEAAQVRLLWASDNDWKRCVDIICQESYPVISPIVLCATCLPPLPTVEILRLRVVSDPYSTSGVLVEDDEWLELLRPFTAVKSLYLSEELQSDLAYVLQDLVGGRTMEVLPSLQTIFLARFESLGPFQEAIEPFLAARQRSGHPIAISQDFDHLPYSFYQSFCSIRSAASLTRRFLT